MSYTPSSLETEKDIGHGTLPLRDCDARGPDANNNTTDAQQNSTREERQQHQGCCSNASNNNNERKLALGIMKEETRSSNEAP